MNNVVLCVYNTSYEDYLDVGEFYTINCVIKTDKSANKYIELKECPGFFFLASWFATVSDDSINLLSYEKTATPHKAPSLNDKVQGGIVHLEEREISFFFKEYLENEDIINNYRK